MAGPTLYIRNALREAEKGIGDGTAYATGTSATVSQVNKTIALVGKVLISDIGADADDKFNSHILYFTSSKNSYHILDWVAATSTATVFEVPETTDTGACEIRRGVVDKDALAGNPALYLSDGLRGKNWKGVAAPAINIHLPNIIENGGFELGSISPWSLSVSGGTADTSGRNTTTPILGVADYKLNAGDRTLVTLVQIVRTMKKNRTYQLLFKARYTGVFVQDFLDIRFGGHTGDELVSSNPSTGNVILSRFRPTLTTTNTWHSADIATPKGFDILSPQIQVVLQSQTFDVFIDEIYLFEKISVAAFLLMDHGGVALNVTVQGRRVSSDRTGSTSGTDFVDLLVSPKVLGGDFGNKEFTAGVYPIYTINMTSSSGSTEIMLAEKWALPFSEEMPTTPKEKKRKQAVFTTRSGRQFKVTQFNEKRHAGTFRALSSTDVARYEQGWVLSHFDDDYPFAVVWETGGELELMINDSDTSGLVYNDVLPDWAFDFKQVL